MASGNPKDNEAVDPEFSDEKINSIQQTTSLHSSDADVGYDLFWKSERLTRDEKNDSINGEKEWEGDSRRVLTKIDRHILPIMCAV